MKVSIVLFVLLFIFIDPLKGDEVNSSVKENKNQEGNCLIKNNTDQSDSFSKLSDEAKKIVFDQLLNITFFPEKETKMFHYPSGFSAEAFTSDKLFSESTRFYREGILAGYYYAFLYLKEDKWKKILDTDGGVFNFNENEFQQFLTEISASERLYLVGITARESQYLASFDVDRDTKNHYAYLYYGFLKGREHVKSLQIKTIQEIREIRGKISNQNKISNDQNKTKPNHEKYSVTIPTLEALLFLKKEFSTKIKVDKLIIEEVIKGIENNDYPRSDVIEKIKSGNAPKLP
jgi:hypothetical protein